MTTFQPYKILQGTAVALFAAAVLFCSCTKRNEGNVVNLSDQDTLPLLQSIGVSTLISDSGIIQYKIIAEDWSIYDKTDPQKWTFEKGLFLQKFNDKYQTEAYISADTAYYYNKLRLWELRSRVQVKNTKGETFKTDLLYWNLSQHRVYSPAFMEVQATQQQLSGYDFSSNEQMTDYYIHSSKGAFPIENTSTAAPKPPVASDGPSTPPKDTVH